MIARVYSIFRLALFSAFAGLFLFSFGPLEVFVHNSEEFSSTPRELVEFLLVVSAIASALIFALLFIVPEAVKSVLIRGP